MGAVDEQRLNAGYDRLCRRLGVNLEVLDTRLAQMDAEGVRVQSITLRMPTGDKPECLVVVRADCDAGRMVAFHSAPTAWEAFNGTLERLYNRSIKWKEDQLWQK